MFLLADDMRWDVMGCAGHTIIKTPNIDALAREGRLFRNHFVTTSICCVSRASIFSGQYERRHQIGDFATPFTAEAWAQTYPALLRARGYRTGFIGKFGVGNEMPVKEFDYWRGFPGQGYYFARQATKPADNKPAGDKISPAHLTARMGDQALDFLAGCKPGEPFCLSLSFKAPHAQDGAPREFPPDARDEGLYADALIPVPANATEEAFARLPAFVQTSEGRRRWRGRFATPEMFQRTVRDYYRLVSGIDREVGRVRDALRHGGLAENTVVVFTSDNGMLLGEHGMADKWLMYEESIRVPLIVLDPRAPAAGPGKSSDAITLNIDLAPTLLDFAGVEPPKGMQGRSLRPLLGAAPVPADWRQDFFYEHHTLPKLIPPTEGVRGTRWKYLRYVEPNPVVEELYDLSADAPEQHNLAADPARAGELARLRDRWAQLRRELN